jgi:hypothetical protein
LAGKNRHTVKTVSSCTSPATASSIGTYLPVAGCVAYPPALVVRGAGVSGRRAALGLPTLFFGGGAEDGGGESESEDDELHVSGMEECGICSAGFDVGL